MRATKGLRAMALLLSATALFNLFSLFGCRRQEPVSGGNVTHADPDAPKTVKSGELTAFSAELFLSNRWYGDERHEFIFTVSPDQNGTLTASEANSGVSLPADEELLTGLSAIIAEYDLASMNGLYDVTAGLPPEAAAHAFHAAYASGEEISFTVNNQPFSAWGEAVCDLYAAWFEKHGITALYPDPEESTLTRFILDFTENGRRVRYSDVHVPESDAIKGETYLLSKSVETSGLFGRDSDKYILFPGDYYEKLTALIASTDLDRKYIFSTYDRAANNYGNHEKGYFGWGDKTTADNEPDSETLKLSLHLTYESGHRVNIDTKKESEIEAMRPLLETLTAYLDPLFE